MRYNIATGVRHVKTKLQKMLIGLAALAFPATLALQIGSGSASTQVIVTPTNQQGWSTADTRPGGAVNFVVDNTAPGNPHNGALQLTTDLTLTAKAQYLHSANTPIGDVTDLSYYTKQNSATFPGGDPSYQLIVCTSGAPTATTCPGFTTFVYEPYQGGQGAVIPGTWQQWNIDSTGLFWSTRTVTCSNGVIVGTPGGPATYTLSDIQTICPEAVVGGFGVNIGSNNPGYDVETDLFNFNGTVYNFEPYKVPTDKDECKNGGWMTAKRNDGSSFKNQGDCIQYVNTGR